MVPTYQLEEIINKCRIIKELAQLPNNILGYYCFEDGYYFILINESINNNERVYRTVLAEEIGHYRTTIGDITPRKYMCYEDRMVIDKKELAALKWAVNFLIPTEMLLNIVKDGLCPTLSEIAEYFVVTEEFITKKFEFMSNQKQLWDIDEHRSLCLYNLPSILIYNKLSTTIDK
jgi:Zn-dependent peptidase ImmA (M78 family)